MKIYQFKQHDEKDCGPACLATIFSYYGLTLPLTRVRESSRTDQDGTSLYGLAKACEEHEFLSESIMCDQKELKELNDYPLIAHVIKDKHLAHYIVVYKICNNTVLIFDPAEGKKRISIDEFVKEWTGVIMTITPSEKFMPGNYREGLYKRFLKLLFPHKVLLIKIFISSLIYTILGILLTFYLRYVIDHVLAEQSSSLLLTISIAVIGLYLVKSSVELVRSRLLLGLSQETNKDMIIQYYRHVIELPQSFYDNRKTGEILSRLNDSGKIIHAISSVSLALMIDSLMMLGAAILLMNQNFTMFLVILVIIPIDIIVTILFAKKYKTINRKQMQSSAELNAHLFETMRIPLQIKSNNIENKVAGETKSKLLSFLKYWFKANWIKNIQYSSFDTIKSLGTTVVIYLGSMEIIAGVFTIGKLMSYTALMSFFLNPVQRLIRLLPLLQEASIASDRLGEILDMKKEKNDTNLLSLQKIDKIEINDVSFGYGYRSPVLENIKFSIERGESIGIVGESGSGKSTLAKLLLKFYDIEQGYILINGLYLKKYSFESVREKIGYVPQDAGLLSGTIKENILFGLQDVLEDEVERCSKIACVEEFCKKMPLKYDTLVGEYGANLSGGQKQRIAIARSLLRNPEVLIMDEATCNLDSETESIIYNRIWNDSGIETLVIISHRLYTVAGCDRIIMLDSGKIVGEGDHKKLIETCEKYRNLWNKQTLGFDNRIGKPVNEILSKVE